MDGYFETLTEDLVTGVFVRTCTQCNGNCNVCSGTSSFDCDTCSQDTFEYRPLNDASVFICIDYCPTGYVSSPDCQSTDLTHVFFNFLESTKTDMESNGVTLLSEPNVSPIPVHNRGFYFT